MKSKKFHQHKEAFSIKNIDINNIVVSNKTYFDAKKNAKKIRPLCICLPKMNAYRKDIDETKYMDFLIKDDELLKKYIEICEKVNNIIKKEFDSERVYNKKYLKAKIKSYNGKINTNLPKEGSQYICLSVSLLDSFFRTGKNYYPQVFLEECKCVVKEKQKNKK